MFKGFCESTIQYWQRIEENNSKATFLDCKELYQTGIQQPLEALYEDLLDYFELLDPDLNFKKNSCISSPYNDARFCGDRPMK